MTYTYTARNANNPDFILTFTLEDDHLRLNVPEIGEKIGQIARADEKMTEAKQQLKTQVAPSVLKAIESFSGPIQINDVAVSLKDDASLRFNAWQRMGGLRLAPLWLNMGRVDNPDAAEAFMTELEERKAAASKLGAFFGPLDYWLGWAGLLLLLAVVFRWVRKNRSS